MPTNRSPPSDSLGADVRARPRLDPVEHFPQCAEGGLGALAGGARLIGRRAVALQQTGCGLGVIDVGLLMHFEEAQAAIVANSVELPESLDFGRRDRRYLGLVNIERRQARRYRRLAGEMSKGVD